MAVNISATFKKDTKIHNGLDPIQEKLEANPLERRTVVAIVETKRVVTDIEAGGTKTVVVGVVHIEPLEGKEADAAKKLLAGALKARTGAAPDQTLFDQHTSTYATGDDADGDEAGE